MFTGLIREIGKVVTLLPMGKGKAFTVLLPILGPAARIGDSIALNGACLTVVALNGPMVQFELSPETLNKTNLNFVREGDPLNAEPSLRLGDVMGGHMVQGHVDGQGKLLSRTLNDTWETFCFSTPPELTKLIAPKGSIAVDGVSLTVVESSSDRFTVALIPHTLTETNFGTMKPGTPVNLESDMVARYVQRLLAYS